MRAVRLSVGQMILTIASIDQREVLQVRIVVVGQIIKHHYTEKFQYLNRCSLYIFTNDAGTLLITQITVFEVAASIGIG